MTSKSSMFTASSGVTASGVMVIREALSRTRFWPSAGLPATSLEARAPLAPGLFTTGIGAPRVLAAPSETARAIRSVLPPGACPTVRFTAPLGYFDESALPPATLPQAVRGRRAMAEAVPMMERRDGKRVIEPPRLHCGAGGPVSSCEPGHCPVRLVECREPL